MGSLGVRFEVEVGVGSGDKITPRPPPTLCLKVVRIMLGTWNLIRKYTHIYFQKIYLLVNILSFFCKNSAFSGKNSTFTQSNSVRAVLKIFRSVFSFCKIKGYCYWKYKFYRLCVRSLASGLLQIGHKLEKIQWRHYLLIWRHCQTLLRLVWFSCQI